MAIEIAGSAASDHDDANAGVVREFLQFRREDVAHLGVEEDLFGLPSVTVAIPSVTFVVKRSVFICFFSNLLYFPFYFALWTAASMTFATSLGCESITTYPALRFVHVGSFDSKLHVHRHDERDDAD